MGYRLEKVVLELDDSGFSTKMAKDAAATAILNRELNSLGKQGTVVNRRLDGMSTRADSLGKSLHGMNAELDHSGSSLGVFADVHLARTAASAARADSSINQLTGRLGALRDVAVTVGPSLIPIGAVSIPAVTGLANQFGVAALAGGVAIGAFQGVGDALKAVNEAALEPTQENLAKAAEELEKLSPAARQLVDRLHELGPALKGLRDTAAAGMFPGLIAGIDALEGRLPDVERIVESISSTLGDMLAGGGESLASGRWDEFFDFLATDASETLADLGHIVGDLTHGMAEMWMAFSPLNNDFSSWMVDVADSFDRWATGLDQTEGFQEFVAYIRENGPQVADTMGALGDAVLQLVQASAPLGGPVLQALEAVAEVVATIAGSDIGTPLIAGYAAMRLLARGQQAFGAVAATTWGQSIQGANGYVGRLGAIRTAMTTGASAAGLFALSMTDVDDQMGISGAAMGTLAGLMIGGPWGAAIGGGIGLMTDFAAINDEAADAVRNLERAVANGASLDEFTAAAAKAFEEINNLRELVNSGENGEFWNLDGQLAHAKDSLQQIFGMQTDIQTETRKALDALNEAGTPINPVDILTGMGELGRYSGMVSDLSDNFIITADSAEDLSSAIAMINDVLEGRSSMRDYEAALDDFTAGLKDNGRTLDINTEKGRANEEALDAIATTAVKVSESLDAADRPNYLRRARKDFLAAADDLRMPRRAAEALADKLGLIGDVKAKPKVDLDDKKAKGDAEAFLGTLNNLDKKHPRVTVTADVAQARAALANIGSLINAIPLSRTTVIRTVGALGSIARADGGPVFGPGTDTSDSILARLSNDEHVLSAREVRGMGGHGAVEQLRADARQGLLGFAKGGTPSSAPRASGGSSSLARTLADFERALKRSEKALEKEKDARDELRSKRDSFASSLSSSYMSDLFGEQNPWTSKGGGPLGVVRGDLANIAALNKARRSLEWRGLDGDALESVLSQGSLQQIQAFSQTPKSQVQEFERLFEQRARSAAYAGRSAANAAYGDEVKAQTRVASAQYQEVKRLNTRIARLEKQIKVSSVKNSRDTAAGVGRAVNGAASRGRRNQPRGRA